MYLRLSPYREILQGVLISLQINEGIIKITGKSGAGKTALCSQLYQELQASGQPAVFFMKPPANTVALQNDILDNLRLDPTGNFTRTLSTFLLARASEQKPLVLIFDDAQQLDPQTFGAIRMLCNIQDQSQGLVRAILCGNEDLDARLAGPALRAVTQFLNQSFTLPYLTKEQVRDFCQAFWLQSNQDMKPLSERVLDRLFDETKGHPGILQARLNQGTTGAEPGDRQRDSYASAVARPYRYAGRKKSWAPAVLTLLGLTALGAGGAYLYLVPQPESTSMNTQPPASATPAAQTVADAPVSEPTRASEAPASQLAQEPTESAPQTLVTADAESADVVEPPTLAAENLASEQTVSGELEGEQTTDAANTPPGADSSAPADIAEASAVADVPTAPPEPDVPEAPAMQPVEAFIAAWTASWQSQDVEAYLAHYDAAFVPAQGTRAEWEQQRRRVIGNAREIQVSAEAPEAVTEAQDGMQVVRFWLNYSAVNYADRTLKELVLAPMDGTWRIRAESNLRTERL